MIIGNVTVNNYLKQSLSTILCIIIQGKGSSGFAPEVHSSELSLDQSTQNTPRVGLMPTHNQDTIQNDRRLRSVVVWALVAG